MFLVNTNVFAQTRDKASIDSLMGLFIKNNCFNGDALITIKDTIFYERAVGFRDNRSKEKIKSNSIFNIGSISKCITSVAVLQLQERQMLNIEDNVKKYLPEFPYDNICIKHLLSHTSGLPGSLDFAEDTLNGKSNNNDSIITVLGRYKPALIFSPGSGWGYSNLGYDLLAILIERVTKMTYPAYVQKFIFTPAGMSKTFIPHTKDIGKWIPQGFTLTDLLVPHMLNDITSCEVVCIDSARSVNSIHDFFLGSSNVYSTTQDLSKFDKALRDNLILGRNMQELAYTPFKLTNGDTAKDLQAPIPSYYGLGWFISVDKSFGRILWHKGRSFGSRSIFIRYPEKQQTVIFTDNFDNAACDLKGIACFRIINNQSYRNPVFMSLVQKLGCGIYSNCIDTALNEFTRLKEQQRKNFYISQDEMIDLSNKLITDNRAIDALRLLEFSKNVFPLSSDVVVAYANLTLKNGNKTDAIENYKKGVDFYSGNEKESLLNEIGYQFIMTGQLESAEIVLELNTELFPNSCNTYDSYATVLAKNNKMQLAVVNEEKAVNIATVQNDKLLPELKQTLENYRSAKK